MKQGLKKYEVQWVRVEHQVTTIEVDAVDEEDAAEKAREMAHSARFGDYEFEVVYADEFVNDIEGIENDE